MHGKPVFHEPRRNWRCLSSGKKGFGRQVARKSPPKSPKKAKPSLLEQYHQLSHPKKPPILQLRQPGESEKDPVEKAPLMEPTQLLELFLSTPEEKRRDVAERYEESLTSDFFVTADFLLSQAEKQDHDMMIYVLKDTIRTAMAVHSKELRPELQLLNRLLVHDTLGARIPILQDKATLEVIRRDDGWIFTCLDSMVKDSNAGRKHDNVENWEAVHQLLLDIQMELKALRDSSLPE